MGKGKKITRKTCARSCVYKK